jgi:penicillin-binding protein 1A
MGTNKSKTDNRHRKKWLFNPFKAMGQFIALVIMICTITACIVASVMTVYVLNTLDRGDSVSLENVKLSFTTIIYGTDPATGEEIELQRLENAVNRIWVDYNEIPQSVIDAAVAVEDKRFWEHSGIDLRRTVAATLNYFNPLAEDLFGGSTITQQVIKNVTGDEQTRIDRKLREIFRSINLEKTYSKEQILESYLNVVAFSGNQNGVQSASNLFYGKDVSQLNAAEAAALIATTQNPTKYNPFSNSESNRERQLMILKMMHEQIRPDGTPMLTDEEYEAAVNYKIEFQTKQYDNRTENIQSWFIDTVFEEVLTDLVDQAGFTQTGAGEALRSGGYRIYTTVDMELQNFLEEKYLNPDTFPPIRNEEYPESAFVILDLQGSIKAIVGSNREKEGSRVFNRATDAVRHPGSTIKPLTSYSPAFEHDLIYWSMIWDDSPILLDEKDPTSLYPKNFYTSPPYRGPITITEAIQRSTNTIPVKLVRLLTPRTSYDFMHDMLGFKHITEGVTIGGRVFSDVDLAPMALGALTGGVTPLEMAGAYQMFGNGGLYYKPHSYTKVLDSEGNVILENKNVPRRVISVETATLMNKLLQRVTNSAPGTGTPAKFSEMPIAGKTGTSDKDYNQWFIGITPYYVGVCWLGYDEMETINYSGHYYPPPLIWKSIMEPIHENLPVVEFETLGNVTQHTYCLESGLLAGSLCTDTATGWYKLSNVPPVCASHQVQQEEVPQEPGVPIGDDVPQFDSDDPLAYWRWYYNVGEQDR